MTSYSVNTVTQGTTRFPQYVAGAAAAGGAFAIGTALGWPSPVGDTLRNEYNLTDTQWDWVGSIITIGAAFSCLPIGLLMKKFGRKWTMIALVIPFLIGWILLIFAQGFWMLFTGRLFLGLAGGAFCISAPQYSAEIAEKEIRGIIGTFFQLLINGGILFVYIIGPLVSITVTNIICAGVAVLFGVIFFFMPESPVFLVIENRIDEAKHSYKWLRGATYDPQWEIDELKAEIAETQRNHITFSEAFKFKSTKMAMFIGFGLATFQQMSGINVVIFYATDIFRAANITLNPDISTIILGSINLGFTVVGSILVDRVGRRILLLISIIGMTLCTTALGVFFLINPVPEEGAPPQDNPEATLGWLPVTSLGLFLVFFALGYGPVVWLMIGEVYSKSVGAVVGPVTGSYNWLFAWLITFFFGAIQRAIGMAWTFWIFSIGSAVGILFTFFIIPETKGKSMAEIQVMLNGTSKKTSSIAQ